MARLGSVLLKKEKVQQNKEEWFRHGALVGAKAISRKVVHYLLTV
jgi:hypothetical protein